MAVTDKLQIIQDPVMSSHDALCTLLPHEARTHLKQPIQIAPVLDDANAADVLTDDSLLMTRLASETNFAREVLSRSAEDCWNDS